MSKLLRYYIPVGVYFVTSVTYDRQPILRQYPHFLIESFQRQGLTLLYDLLAWVIMPDHFHAIVDARNCNLSNLMKRIKLSFAYSYRKERGMYRGRCWQPRFWDHVIRDQRDLNRHIDYIHYNPVKHGLVHSPFEWKYSSIHRFLREGYVVRDWGRIETPSFDGDFGE